MKDEPTTYGELKAILAREPRGDWPSRVNPSLTHSQAIDVLTRGINTRADDMLIADDCRGFLMVRNVLRECRSRS